MSLTIIGLVVAIIGTVGKSLGIDVDQGHMTECFLSLVQIGGAVAAWYGRVRQGDVNILGLRK